MSLNPDTFNRLSLGIIERDRCSPEEAMGKLASLRINLICGDLITRSLPLQAALLTAVNTGVRAFLGGVFVKVRPEIKSLIPWPNRISLADIVRDLGGQIVDSVDTNAFSLHFGLKGSIDENSLEVVCNDWQAGVLANGETFNFNSDETIGTGGVFAGSLGIALAFFRISGICISSGDKSVGISLWRPDIHWLNAAAAGPAVKLLPQKYWMLGLGHLGQAYLWNIGLLPYANQQNTKIVLQDDDKMVAANWSAGLLTESESKNIHKTRLCSNWLEERGFQSGILERRFDENTKRARDEPYLALCGFDNADSRLLLENAGFDLIVEAGLGNNLSTFDTIAFHTFPNGSKSPQEIWAGKEDSTVEFNQAIYDTLKEADSDPCGIVPLTIAGKTVSASFVGACSGAMVLAEILRGLHEGMRYEKVAVQLRDLENIKAVPHKNGVYTVELARNGFVNSSKIR